MSILSAFFILLIFLYYFLCYNLYSDSSDILLEVFLWLFSLKNLLLKVVPIFPSLKVITPLKSMVVLIAPINHLLLLKLGKPKVLMILLPIFKKKWMNSTKIIKTRILLRFPIILLNSILDIFHSYP